MGKEKISITVESGLIKTVDTLIDKIYIRNRSQAIEHLIKKSIGKNKTAVILAGGDEKKIKISKNEYRFTAKINNETLIEKQIRKLRNDGFKNLFIIARKKVIAKFFEIVGDGSDSGMNINYVEEKNSSGTAESLRLLRGKIKDKFIVIYGDILFDNININEIWNQHNKNNASATIMLTTSNKPSEKGNVTMEGNKVLDFLQKPKKSENFLVFSPIFMAEPEILNMEGDSLESDIFPKLAKSRQIDGFLSSEKEKHIHTKEDLF